MKRNPIISMTTIMALVAAFLTANVNVYASAYVEMVDGTIYPPDALDDSYYSNNKSKKSNNLMTMFKDFVGADIIEDKWNEFTDNIAVKWEMTKTGVGSYITSYLNVFDFLENEIDEGKTGNEAIEEWGIKQVEALSPITSIKNKVVNSAQKLTDKGKSVSPATTDLLNSTNERRVVAEEYFEKKPERAEKIELGLAAALTLALAEGDMTADEIYSAFGVENPNMESSTNGGIIAEGNGASKDLSDGISEDELIQELMYLDTLGLSDEEFDRQLEEWAAQHGAN